MILELESVNRAFGPVKVADDIDLDIAQGTALGIIGPNGTGRTSVFNLIAGALRPDAGTIRLNGQDITQIPTRARARAGLARSYRIPQPFGNLTVFENLLVAATFGGRQHGGPGSSICAGRCWQTPAFSPLADRRAGTLTLLERKRLELARALAIAPRLLLLDEIGGGLTEAEMRRNSSRLSADQRRPASRSSGSSTWCPRSSRWSIGCSCSTSVARSPRANRAVMAFGAKCGRDLHGQ